MVSTGTRKTRRPVRIANCSGFYGDRFTAMTEVLEGGPVDVITGDYLAELTMLILARQKADDPEQGFAKSFLGQLKASLADVLAQDVRIVVNAGGMNPSALAKAVSGFARDAGAEIAVAHVIGDDLTSRAADLGFGQPIAANAYLGGFGIARALEAGAQVVVTGRVTDASLTVGAAAWWHGWDRTDYNQIAGAMAAGHITECGTQATGGNFSFFQEIPDMLHPGFPIAEVAADGGSIITKHPNSGGAVTEETVLSQLLYEIQGARYAGPDAVLRLDSLRLAQEGPDRVAVYGAQGEPPPPELKVSCVEIGGYINELTWLITGAGAEAKAELVKQQFESALETRPAELVWSFAQAAVHSAANQEEATSTLRLTARDPDAAAVGRRFANIAVEYALASYPGLFMDSPPQSGRIYGRYSPRFVPQDIPRHTVVLPDGADETVPVPQRMEPLEPTDLDSRHPVEDLRQAGDVQRACPQQEEAPLFGDLFGTRSGDKGGSANIGVWARSEIGRAWLGEHMTVELLRELLPEIRGYEIDRTRLDNVGAVNFVIHGYLGEGVASNHRYDPQAKGLGEYLRSRRCTVPAEVQAAPVDRGRVQEENDARSGDAAEEGTQR